VSKAPVIGFRSALRQRGEEAARQRGISVGEYARQVFEASLRDGGMVLTRGGDRHADEKAALTVGRELTVVRDEG